MAESRKGRAKREAWQRDREAFVRDHYPECPSPSRTEDAKLQVIVGLMRGMSASGLEKLEHVLKELRSDPPAESSRSAGAGDD
jgi:hypothetical protein